MSTATDRPPTWNDWIGATVVDRDGDKIGTLDGVYMDRGSGRPEWLAVTTGLFGTNQTFIPLAGTEADGEDLRVPHTKDRAKDAPAIEAEGGFLSSEEEARLYQHYGRDDYRPWDDAADADVGGGWGDEHDERRFGVGAGTDVSGPGTDEAMTRSEEELEVGTRQREAGRVRLRKYVVTEDVTTTVPVRKERVRIEREPITEANQDPATDGPAISEEEHEVVLQEEVPVVSTRAVPKERVRIEKEVDVAEQEVGGEVRKEQIEVDGDDQR